MNNTLIFKATHSCRVKMDTRTAQAFAMYLQECTHSGFRGVNNFDRVNKVREKLFRCVLHDLSLDYLRKLSTYMTGPQKNIFGYTLSEVERITLSFLFNRVEVPPVLLPVQYTIINHLTI
jgi:hypothetical protein